MATPKNKALYALRVKGIFAFLSRLLCGFLEIQLLKK